MLVKIDWSKIDDVLLDMDGTLLDLHFDATFWLKYIHTIVSNMTGESKESIHERFLLELASKEGTLDWYCTDYWSDFFGCDVIKAKKHLTHLIRFRPHARSFLELLKSTRLRTLIITNAHPDVIAIKANVVPLNSLVDELISSHDFGMAKEHPRFWMQLFESLQIDPRRSIFFDDSPKVLQAAYNAGIAEVIEIRHPNLSEPPRTLWHVGIDDFDDLIPCFNEKIL